MKVIIKHGVVNYLGNLYSKGDSLDISEHFYNCHKERFEKAAKKISKAKVITNNEPTKAKAKKAENDAASIGKTPNEPKQKSNTGKKGK